MIVEEEKETNNEQLFFENLKNLSDRDDNSDSESLVSLESRQSNEEELRQFCSKYSSAPKESSNSVNISENKEKMQ